MLALVLKITEEVKLWLPEQSTVVQVSRGAIPSVARSGTILLAELKDGIVKSTRLADFDALTIKTECSTGRIQVSDLFVITSPREAFSKFIGFVNIDVQMEKLKENGAVSLWAEFEECEYRNRERERFYVRSQTPDWTHHKESAEYMNLIQMVGLHPSFPNGEWLNGIVAGIGHNRRGKETIFFVQTPLGPLVMYPRTYKGDRNIVLGAYVRVQATNRRDLDKKGAQGEVVKYDKTTKPCDHEVKVFNSSITIGCNARVGELRVARGMEWRVFHNEYLGRIAAVPPLLRPHTVQEGEYMRIKCKRTVATVQPVNGKGWNWEVEEVGLKITTAKWINKESELDKSLESFEGFVDFCHASSVSFVCSPQFPDIHLVLYNQDEKLAGKWIRFHIVSHVPPGNTQVRNNFELIDEVYPIRRKGNRYEVLTRCHWGGENIEGYRVLTSLFGRIWDESGEITYKGQYDAWICWWEREKTRTKWKFSNHPPAAKLIRKDMNIELECESERPSSSLSTSSSSSSSLSSIVEKDDNNNSLVKRPTFCTSNRNEIVNEQVVQETRTMVIDGRVNEKEEVQKEERRQEVQMEGNGISTVTPHRLSELVKPLILDRQVREAIKSFDASLFEDLLHALFKKQNS